VKIKPDHFEHMRNALAAWNTDYYRSRYAAAGLSTKRFQWDAVSAAGLTPFVCDTLYTYANDDHIQTALNRIIAPIECAA
jgi:hypothetical protein